MQTTTITEEFMRRTDNELRYNSKLYQKNGEPFGAQLLSSMAGGSFPAVDFWHGLWYQGEMACLFGEPNVGKTILAMQIANELCKRGLKTFYYDFENAAHQFKSRYKTDKFDYNSGDGEFVVKPLNPYYSNAPLDSRSILNYIKNDIVTEHAHVVIIDDITHIIGSGDQADVRFVLNTLRSWTQLFMVSILVLAHSKRRKPHSLITIDSLAGSFEYSYAFDSIFSLARTNFYNTNHNNITHYIKHHKNRMGPVNYHEFNVITAQFGRDENNGFLQFNNLITGGNERQLLRDYGYNTPEQITQAIIQYRKLFLTTREIASIVGCSQSHVSKTLKKHQATTTSNQEVTEQSTKDNKGSDQGSMKEDQGSMKEKSHSESLATMTDPELSIIPEPMPRIKLEPNLTPIYDPSRYIIDPYGERITIEEYNEYYADDPQEAPQEEEGEAHQEEPQEEGEAIPAIPAIPQCRVP